MNTSIRIGKITPVRSHEWHHDRTPYFARLAKRISRRVWRREGQKSIAEQLQAMLEEQQARILSDAYFEEQCRKDLERMREVERRDAWERDWFYKMFTEELDPVSTYCDEDGY